MTPDPLQASAGQSGRDQVALSIGEALIFLRGEAIAVGLDDLAQSLSRAIDAAANAAKTAVYKIF